MAEFLYRVARFATRRSATVLLVWGVILGLAGVAFAAGYRGLASSFDIPGMESNRVTDQLAESLPEYAGAVGTAVISSNDGSPLKADQREQIVDLIETAQALPHVASIIDPFAAEATRASTAAQLRMGATQLSLGQAQLDASKTQFDSALAELTQTAAQLDSAEADQLAARQQLEAAHTQAQTAGAPTTEIERQLALLDAADQALAAQRVQLDAGLAELEALEVRLQAGQAQLDSATEQIQAGETLLELAKDVRAVSEDESTALVNIVFTLSRLELPESSKQAVIEHFTTGTIEGAEVSFSAEIAQGVPQIFGLAEIIAISVAALVLLVMLGGIVIAAVPVATAIVGVGIGAMITLAFSGVTPMTSVTPILGVMLGLAVGIDYALFIVNRHRRQLRLGTTIEESIAAANGTAGTAVVFAGSTVIVALLALNIIGIPFLGVMGNVGAVSIAIAVLIAVTAVPALLALLGKRALSQRQWASVSQDPQVGLSLAERASDGNDSESQANGERQAKPQLQEARPMRTIQAIALAAAAIALLLTLAIPSASIRLGLPDGSAEPVGSYPYTAFVTIEDKFGAGNNAQLLVTTELPEGMSEESIAVAQAEIAQAISQDNRVSGIVPAAVSEDGKLAAFQVIPSDGPNAASTEGLVQDLRAIKDQDGQAKYGVAGQAAINIDMSAALAEVLPKYLALVVGLSLVIMILVFRSLLVPLIAASGFVVSLFATLGVTVAVYQWGWFAPLFGLARTGPILNFLPIILMGILFGLAMDYQLFTTTGMRESYAHGSPPRLAVARGLRAGRPVVIAAALIMIAVFSGFVASNSVIVSSLGFGLAVGVLVDAFVVRLVLMPSLMHLLGSAAWWLPRWLDKLLPPVDVEGLRLKGIRREL